MLHGLSGETGERSGWRAAGGIAPPLNPRWAPVAMSSAGIALCPFVATDSRAVERAFRSRLTAPRP